MKRLLSKILLLVFLLINILTFTSAVNAEDADVAIVFTHDLHSHVDSFVRNNKEVGGFSRIKTVIDNTKNQYENTVVLDGGDFSMGTLYQTSFMTSAVEYRMLGLLGYDATTFGNHEFDYQFDGLTKMITAAQKSGDPLPPILSSNIDKNESGFTDAQLSDLNIKKYEIIKKGDYTIAVFGLLGRDAVELSSSGKLVFYDFIDAAKETVEEIKSLYSPDLIVCLSHSGTGESVNNEDVQLAEAVPDIDVIISGHTHTYLFKPIIVGDTIIASCGEYGEYVGQILLDVDKDTHKLVSYTLMPVTADITENNEIKSVIDVYEKDINKYLNKFGYENAGQIIANSPFVFTEQSEMSSVLAEQPLGNMISDAYVYAVKQAEGENYIPVDVATVPSGVIRDSVNKGNVTVSQIFEISSLGIGADGTAGYPLCSVYLYGSELWTVAEIDASVSSIMSYAQLYSSGLHYSVNTSRMFLNRVYDCWLVDENGNRVEIEDDKLYRVVSGIYSAQMLGTVKDKSFGLLELTPKDKNGNPITDFNKHIIKTDNGVEIKEWTALADYMSSFPDVNDVPTVPERYKSIEGRKTINTSFSFGEFFTNWNFVTWTVLFVIILFIALISFVVTLIIKKRRKQKRLKLASVLENN